MDSHASTERSSQILSTTSQHPLALQPTGARAAVGPVTGLNDAKVTVGIPTFNRAHWLKDSIESVLAQSYTRFHIIVSDNASTDETPDVVKSFDDRRITYIRSDHNIGSVANVNQLIGLADTEYVVILPDDDFFYPGYLEAAVGLFDQFDSLGAVHSAFNHVDARARVIGRVDPVRCRSRMMIERSDQLLERLMVTGRWLCFASVMYRTEALIASGGLNEDLGHFVDHDMWMQLALHWDFGYLAEPLVGQRDHARTVSWQIVTDNGFQPNTPEAARLYAELALQRRTSFINKAGFEPERADRLRALATLQSIVDLAHAKLPSREVASRLAQLVRAYPRILSRPAFWRLLAAQSGARRVRTLLTGARHRQSGSAKALSDC
jgi:glycosyltransferase involved in cell wall biosynthesis